MRTSESTVKLVAALVLARRAFAPVIREAVGQVGQNRAYKYADLAGILDAVMPALLAQDLVILQAIDAESASLITRLAHVSGEWAEASYPLKLDQPPQQFGSSLTYGRRYSLQSLLCLAAEDDDGAAAEVKPLAKKKLAAANTSPIVTRPTAKPSDKTISDTQRRKLFAVAAAHGWTEHEWREQMDRGFGCLSTKQLQPEDYEQLLAILQRRPRVQTDGVSEPQ
jgi:hypothetical protein